jgi:O-succinylbenzoate synthase
MTDGGAEILRVPLAVRPEARAIVGADAREVAFLRVVDEASGRAGYGECAPLPGLHSESLDEACEALEAWCDGACALEELPPSAAFAASTATAMLDGFGARSCRAAEVAAFFLGGADELDEMAVAALAGAAVVKLKIGRMDADADRALLARALAAWPRAHFRIDGNRRLDLAGCLERLRGVDAARIEYLEEPLRDPSELERLAHEAGIPVALDELVVEPGPEARALRERLSGSGCVAAWVLRMSAIGPLDAVRARAAEAVPFGVDAVLSTAFESSFSLRVAVHLAASIPNATRPHGIGTAAVLAEDSCPPARADGGVIAGDPLSAPFAEAWS